MANRLRSKIYEEFQQNRKKAIEIVLVVSGLAILINLFASFLFLKLFGENAADKIGYWALLIVLIMLVILVIIKFINDDIEEHKRITILIPIKVCPKTSIIEIEKIYDYKPAVEAKKLLEYSGVLKDKTSKEEFFAAWKQMFQNTQFNQQNAAWNLMGDLTECIIIKILYMFGIHTLKRAALFSEYWGIFNKLPVKTADKEELISILKGNRFVSSHHFINKLFMPKDIEFTSSETNHIYKIGRLRRTRLACKYGKLEIEILPHWKMTNGEAKTQNIVARKWGIEPEELDIKNKSFNNIYLLRIPLEITLSFKSFEALCNRESAENYLEWLEKLYDLFGKSDWDYFNKNDMEKLVVKLYKELVWEQEKQAKTGKRNNLAAKNESHPK